MDSEVLDNKKENNTAKIFLLGIIFFLTYSEALLTLSMIFRELIIIKTNDYRNTELIIEGLQILVTIIFLIVISLKLKFDLLNKRINRYLRVSFITLMSTIIFTYIHNTYLVPNFPIKYFVNLEKYEVVMYSGSAAWMSYWFGLSRHLIIIVFFYVRYYRTTDESFID